MTDAERGLGDGPPPGLSPLARRLIGALSGVTSGGAPARALDVQLATRLVRLVGTSLYGLPQRAGSIDQAVALLGLDTVQRLALAIELLDSFSLPPHDVERGALRRTLLMQAVAARRLAVETDGWDPEEAFLGGLLADCGALVMLDRFPAYRDLLACYYAGRGEIIALERDAFGEDHAALTLRLIEDWGLPARICGAVRSRWHDLDDASQPGRILAAASSLARVHTVAGFASEGARAEGSVSELLDLPPALVASIAAGLPGELRQVIDALEPEPVSGAVAHDPETWPDPSEIASEVDPATGLLERDGFERLIDVFHDRAVQLHRPLALLVLEIDGRKALGAETARELLVDVAQRISELVRRTDPHARVARARVAILAPGCAAADVPRIAQRIRLGVEGGGIETGAPQLLIGMSAADPHHDGTDAGSLRASAYTALSRAELAPERTWVA